MVGRWLAVGLACREDRGLPLAGDLVCDGARQPDCDALALASSSIDGSASRIVGEQP